MRTALGFIFGIHAAFVIGVFVCGFGFSRHPLSESVPLFARIGLTAIGFYFGFRIGSFVGSLTRRPGKTPSEPKTTSNNPLHSAPQIAGSPCVACGQSILSMIHGRHCQSCGNIYHINCAVGGQCPACTPPLENGVAKDGEG